MFNKHFRIPRDKSRIIPSLRELFVLPRFASKSERAIIIALLVAGAVAGLVAVWAISSSYLITIPARGGSFSEGILGVPRHINPLLASSDADRDLVTLIYSGLLRATSPESYINDLAESYEISTDGLVYTVKIKEAKWHDGVAVSAGDVAFTIRSAQSSLIKSPRRANWEGVGVEVIDSKTIRFTLKQPYAPFLENLTMGILPEHKWKSVSPEEFALSPMNLAPIGTGPYKYTSSKQGDTGTTKELSLTANQDFTLGEPNISKIVLRFYLDEKNLVSALEQGVIGSVSGLSAEGATSLTASGYEIVSTPLPRVFGLFFNQNQSAVLSDPVVREVLERSTPRQSLIDFALFGFATGISDPLGMVPSNTPAIDKEELDLLEAKLDKAGWKVAEDGIRAKKNIRLEFSIATQDGPEFKRASNLLADNWEALGIDVSVKIYEASDLNANVIRTRKFDALLVGTIMGHFPDPYAFWHPSQRVDPGLNITQYTNTKAAKALDEARKSTVYKERQAQYAIFENEVNLDKPAIFLYLPHYIYLPNRNIINVNLININNPSDRFLPVYNWYIKSEKIWKIFTNTDDQQ